MQRKFKIQDSSILISWFSVAISLGYPLIILPVALNMYSPEQMALWLYISLIFSAGIFADFGFTPTFIRYFSYVFEAVEQKNTDDSRVKYKYKDVYAVSGIFYPIISLLIVTVLVGVMPFTVENLSENPNSTAELYLVVCLALVAVYLQVNALRWSALLQGYGLVSKAKKIDLIYVVIKLIFGVVLIITYKSVVHFVFGMVLASLIYYLLYKYVVKVSVPKAEKAEINKSLVHEIWSKSWRLGLTNLGSYLIFYGTSHVATMLDSIQSVNQYLISIKIVMLLRQVSNVAVSVLIPKISRLYHANKVMDIKQYLINATALSLIVYVLGSMFIMLIGNELLSLISIDYSLINDSALIVLCLIYLLELHHGLHANVYMQSNHIPFVIPSVVSGVLIVFFSYLYVDEYGLWALLLSQLFVQLCFNNWYPVYLMLNKVNLGLLSYMAEVFKSLIFFRYLKLFRI